VTARIAKLPSLTIQPEILLDTRIVLVHAGSPRKQIEGVFKTIDGPGKFEPDFEPDRVSFGVASFGVASFLPIESAATSLHPQYVRLKRR
jgi:hypothetical protein